MAIRSIAKPTEADFQNSLPLAAIRNQFLAEGEATVRAWVGHRDFDALYGTKPVFHFSGGECIKEDVLKKAGIEGEPQKALSAVTSTYGRLVEALMSAACQWKGVSAAREIKVWRDWAFRAGYGHKWSMLGRTVEQGPRRDLSDCLIVGSIDEIVVWDGWAYIIDWKSVHPWKFDHLDEKPDEGYMKQAASYRLTYQEQFGNTVELNGVTYPLAENPRLIYVDRASMRMRQIGVDMQRWASQARARWYDLRAAWEDYQFGGEVPKGLAVVDGKTHWKCGYCRYGLKQRNDGQYICPEQAQALLKKNGGNGNGVH